MSLLYRLCADAVVVVHFAYAMTIVMGLLLILIGIPLRWQWIRNFRFRLIHLTMILIVVVESWAGIECPLTALERHLRELAGQATYRGDFVANIVHEVLFFEFTPQTFTWIYSAFGLLILGTLVLAPPHRTT
jgi:hypothetical protein